MFHMIIMLSLFFLLKSKGLAGIAYAYLITEMFFYFVYIFISYSMLQIEFKSIIKTHVPFLYIIITVLLISFLLKFGCNYFSLSIGMKFIVEMVGTPILFLVIFFIYSPAAIKSTIREVLPVTVLNQNKYFNYLMKVKVFRKYWSANWGTPGL